MNIVIRAMALVVCLFAATAAFAQGNAEAGKKLWGSNTQYCSRCHGTEGQGGFGPDLAGRGLSVEQFRRAVRTPWGIMPTFIEAQLSDAGIADMVAYFNSLPRVAAPGPWRETLANGAPLGQQLAVATWGCGQCHGATFDDTRADAGAAGADFAWFSNLVYNHTTAAPEERKATGNNLNNPIRMGNFSRVRVPEPMLRQLWQYLSVDLGLRAPFEARWAPSVAAGPNMTYTLNVENAGVPGKGLVAEDISVALTLPAGSKVVSTSGAGYQGLQRDPKGTDVAVWRVAKMSPRDKQTYVITLSPPAAGAERLRGVVRWSKPVLANGSTDSTPINPPPAAQP
jgi:mono/diheme cytochrome c family protein